MMTQAQLDLLRRMAHHAQQTDMDVGLGANVLLALVDEIERLNGAVRAERAACAKTAYQYGCADARDAILRRSKGNMHDE